MVDTLRRDRLSTYGAERTTSPTIDALAQEGVRYDRVVSQAPWTLPSIAATLTGRLPMSMGIRDERVKLPEDVDTLAEVLAAKGYATAGFISHSFCSAKWGFDQGFDVYDGSSIAGHRDVVGSKVSDRALEWLETRPEEEPFFLFLHYFDPHYAYIRHEEFEWSSPEGYDGWVESNVEIGAVKKAAKASFTPADRDALLRLYDSEVAYTDAQIRRVFDVLRAQGVWEDTVVVFTHDHGEEFMEHDRIGHTTTLWDEVIGAPLVVKYPRGAGGLVDDQPRALVDIYPTVLGLVGEAVPDGVGEDLRGDIAEDRVRYSATDKGKRRRAVFQSGHVFMRDLDKGTEWLFADSDVHQRTNLVKKPAHAARVEAMGALVDAWPSAGAAPAVEISDEERARLEALGYVEDEP